MSIETEHRRLVRRPILEPSPLQKHMPGASRLETHEHLILASLGGTGIEENYIFVFGPIEPGHVFNLARSFFGKDEYSIVVESGMAEALDQRLLAENWPIDEDVPSMLLAPIPAPPLPMSGLNIRPVSSEAEFADFLHISQTGRRWIPSLDAATDPDVCLLVGYLDGVPVATSRINCLREVGEINGVVTDPNFRRRGFGTAMTWAAIDEGVKHGCTAIVLTATELGYPVYARMGFVPVCTYRTYLRPDRSLNTTSEVSARAQTDS